MIAIVMKTLPETCAVPYNSLPLLIHSYDARYRGSNDQCFEHIHTVELFVMGTFV